MFSQPSWTPFTMRRSYPQFVAAFDQLMPDRVRWTPYTDGHVQHYAPRGLSDLCSRDAALWLTRRYLVFDITVEPYAVHRVFRQLGYYQQFPPPRPHLDQSHL